MVTFSLLVSDQIRFLLESLNDSNFDVVLNELLHFVEYGTEGSILLLRTCLDHVNFDREDIQKLQLRPDILAAIFRYLLDQPNFGTVFAESLGSMVISEKFLGGLCDALHLSVFEKIALGLALADINNAEMRTIRQNFSMGQIEELCGNPASIGSAEKIQNIIIFLYRSEGLAKHVDSFMQMLSLMDPKERTPLILAPLLSSNLQEARSLGNLDTFYGCSESEFDAILAEMESETSMADIMRELGYGCTFNSSHCKEVLSLFSPLTEVTLSRILSTIARTFVGLEENQNSYSTFCSAIGSTASSDLNGFSSWNVDVLVNSIKELAPRTNWVHVMEHLDHEGFFIPNNSAFSFFMSTYAHACQDPFPLHAVCGSVWKNADGQLSFLRYAVSAPPEIFTFDHSVKKLAYNEVLYGYEHPDGPGNHAWLSLDLLEVLCQLAERGHMGSVRAMLEYPLKHTPGILLLGIAQINTAYSLLQCEVVSTVFPLIVASSMKSVILHLWHSNPKLVTCGFIDMIRIDQGNMLKIVDICQELKILQLLLEQSPFSFGIRLAVLASQKEYINLETWLNDNLTVYKDIFLAECLKFLKEMTFDAADDVSANLFEHSGAVVNLQTETNLTILKVLQDNSKQFASDHLAEELKRMQETSLHVGPRLQNVGASDASASEGYADDIEDEVNSYFQKIFSGQVPVDTIVQMLARFKESYEQREQLIFRCMIHNLFEEYSFFLQYPEKQLKIAAVLFGSLIKHRLVTHLELGIALRGVLDALRKPIDSKIFSFGTKALEQFLDCLVELPQYCNHILQISHLRGTHPELVALVERALARASSGYSELNRANGGPTDPHNGSPATLENVEVPDSSQLLGSRNTQPGQQISSPIQMQQGYQLFLRDRHKESTTSNSYAKPLLSLSTHPSVISSDTASYQNSSQILSSQNTASVQAALSSSSSFLHSSRGITSTRFGSALNIETLIVAAERRDTAIKAPASEVQDKILFMINNISTLNIDAKAKDFTEILSEQYYSWFAQYMVMKRASIEPNFHDLYLKFLDKVNSKALNKEIVKAAYENCKVLLRSELIKSSSEERSLLKNLGSWLGKFTIGRNQVLRASEIDPKSLIIEAYQKGLMIAVIPFTSKILEPCQSSLAYQPPNPWTMAILGLLTEIYLMPNLKMNLKFDIEVLFKNLGVDMKEVKPTSLLKDCVRAVEGNPDFSNKDIGASQPQVVTEVNSGIIPTLNLVDLNPEIVNSSHPGGRLKVIPQYVGGLHLASGPLVEDEKIAGLGLPDRLPSAQVAPSQQPYSVGQLPSPIHNIGNHIILNQKLSALGLHYFQRVVPSAMELAIKEVMLPIVQRSVAIATQTTKELVLKDYAMESDETRIYNAAHLMVASLAGSLAHVTCKEPLRISISNQLRSSFQGSNISNELLEQAVPLVMNDNLDLGCAVIEQAATEKALQTIDADITAQLSLRRKHREGIGPSFYNASVYTQRHLGVIPEALRPRPGHLSHSQQRVYEDFVRFPWQNQSGQSSNTVLSGPHTPSGVSVSSGLSRTYVSSAGQLNPGFYSAGLGTIGLSAVTQPSDVEEMEPSSAQFLSGSSTRIGAIDGVIPHGSKINSVASFSQLPLHLKCSVGTFNAAKVRNCHINILSFHLISALGFLKGIGNFSRHTYDSTSGHLGSGTLESSSSVADVLEKYQIVAQKLETLVTKDSGETEIRGVIAQIPELILKYVNRDEVALAVAQKVFNSLYENVSNSIHVAAHLSILVAIRDVCKNVMKHLTSWVIYSKEERKFNTNVTVGLIRKDLLDLDEYDKHMGKLIDAGRNKAATEFAINLLQTLLVQESRVHLSELPGLVDALAKLALRAGSPESLQQLVEIAKNPAANEEILSGVTVGKEDRTKQTSEIMVSDSSMTSREGYINAESVGLDPAGFHDQVIYSKEERKFNTNVTVGLIRKDLLDLDEYDKHMGKLIDAGRNKAATEFAINLLQTLLVQESRVHLSELPGLVDALAKLALRAGSPESLQQLVEIAKNPAANEEILSGVTVGKEDRTKQTSEIMVSDSSMTSREGYINAESVGLDPAGFHDQVSAVFKEWSQIYGLHGANDDVCMQFIAQLHQNGYLDGDGMSDRFFRILTEFSVEDCLPSEQNSSSTWLIQSAQATQNLSFVPIDAYAKLVSFILRYCIMEHGPSKLLLWPKILSVTVRIVQRDAEVKKGSFNPRPYFRLLINWLFDLVSQDPASDIANFQVLIIFANAFHALQPLKVPAFSFAWLELVSHCSFMPKLLTINVPKGWIYVQCLLVDLFRFMEPYLRNAELGEPIHSLYKGTLRVLLVLLHDFPEFLGDNHFSFCDVIPSSCIQMRNVILSAFPRNMRLPDPSTPNLKIDLLPEMHRSPHIFSEVDAALKAKQMKSDVDEYLKTRHQGSPFLSELKQGLLLSQNEAAQAGTRYNVPLINSLVLYVGMQTIEQLQTKTPPPLSQPITHNGPMELYLMGPALDIFQTLIVDLDTEGRYLFLNAIANQLRYPNNHTHLFSFVLLYLFNEASQEIIQEQITRVLFERLIVNRPHPWGLLTTFIELIKNPRYNFWNRGFTRCAPEIEKLFESVSRSCGGPKPVDESIVSGVIADNMH
ncbi:CCR4-NOT transcription complex subunit 1-like [Pistacia vera]|uniref:CCR4-NOT transcription complex subunit 1-like n=1 Tax=Pistacia vera TaxID=55513 RepID=UPI001262BD54|nr:CCR4-NOT transcription complex subunit 1-like [Pistacia vera]